MRPLLRALATADPHDVIATLYIGGGLARQKVANIGSALVSDGWCPAELRAAFEESGGQWGTLGSRASGDELRLVADRYEPALTSAQLVKLRETLSFSAAPVSAVADEPLPAVRVAGIAARFGDFYAGSSRANSPGVVSHSRDQQLRSFDVVADGIRVAAVNSGGISQAGEPANYARAFTASPVSTLHLSLARARYDFRIGEPILASAEANHVLAQLKSASERADKLLDAWDAGWLQLLSQDVGAFLNHSRQGWRMSRDFADGGSKRISWLLVFDGLRYDLWQSILAPAIKRAGWRVPDSDTSFAFLPSVTEVSRRTVIGGSPDAARGQEAAKAKTLAERAGAKLTYQVRTEAFDKEREDVEGWNVRVFS